MSENETEFRGLEAPRAQEYLSSKHQEISEDYHAHCGVIADEVAKLLLEDGLNPHIEIVYEELHDSHGNTRVKSFLPEKYRDKREPWHGHFVCCTDTYAFDPIIGHAVPKENYTTLAFGETIEMKMSVPPEELRKRLQLTE